MNNITMTLQVDHLIMEALREDISSEDVTTNAVMHEAVTGEVDLICKQDGVIAGLQIFQRVFELLDKDTKVEFFCKDGDEVKNGQLMGKVTGDIRVLLSGERVALNYLQRMSGIASYTHSVASLLEGSRTKLLDTRKTTPNMRIFENMQSEWAEDTITATISLMGFFKRTIISEQQEVWQKLFRWQKNMHHLYVRLK